jgi:hypothetical protein
MMPLNRKARSVFTSVFLLVAIDVYAAEQPKPVEQKPQYIRTRDLPALKLSFSDMQAILEKAANLLSDANANAPKEKEFYFRETLTVGTEPDQIEIAGHSFPSNARLPKAAIPFSYYYSWTDAPVSRLQLDLRDTSSRLVVSGTAVDQVESISAALERDLLQHPAPAAEKPKLVEQKPQYVRTRELPVLKISFGDMQHVLETTAKLLSNANRDEGKKPTDIYLTETLHLGTGPDEIKVADHTFPENARIPKTAYALSYSYSWTGAPVSSLELDLRDYGNKLSVAGPAVEQVEAISAALEHDLAQHSAFGGATARTFGGLIIVIVFTVLFSIGWQLCVTQRQWRFVGILIFSFAGLVLLYTLPFREIFPGFAVYQGEPSFIVRYEPQIAFGGLILTIALSFLIPMWQEARRKETATKEE